MEEFDSRCPDKPEAWPLPAGCAEELSERRCQFPALPSYPVRFGERVKPTRTCRLPRQY